LALEAFFLLEAGVKHDAAQSRLWRERNRTVQDMIFEQLLEQALFTAYRVGAYALQHLMDDPALLAIVFC
jgi:hypothetical protein